MQLRHVLERSYPSAAERDRASKYCLTQLRSLADWQGAAMLVEWRESATNQETAGVDRRNHALVLEKFRHAVRQILRQREQIQTVSTLAMLTRMAAAARAAGEPLTLVRGFAPDLIDLVRQGPPQLRSLAARTLAQIEPPVAVAVPALSGLLQNDEVILRRAAADSFALLIQNALQATGAPRLIPRPEARSDLVRMACAVVTGVHAGLNDKEPEVRRGCLQSLGVACAALTRLMEGLPENEQSSARRTLQAEYEEVRPLLQALCAQGPALERCLHDNDSEARILTHKALEELGIARERWSRRCTAPPSTPLRAGGVEGGADEKLLDQLLHQALPGVTEGLTHPNVLVRRSALDVLETSGPLALPSLPALTRALHDPDRFVRWSAVRTVGKLGPTAAPQTFTDLIPLLHDPDADLRKAAAQSLQRLRSATNESRP